MLITLKNNFKCIYIEYMDITIVFQEPEELNELHKSDVINFNLLDEGSRLTRSKARQTRGRYAARKTPFAIVTEDDKISKVFYSERDDVIMELNKIIDEC